MNSLIELLSHPYLITNRVAESVYQEEGAAIQQRLRSRIKGRHHFTVEDYQAIRKEAINVSRQLDRIADKLDKKEQAGDKQDWLLLMQHPWLNHKHILKQVGKKYGLSYYKIYDSLRDKVDRPQGFIGGLSKEYRRFASWIRQRLDEAKVEKKEYVFSVGRGGGSHRG